MVNVALLEETMQKIIDFPELHEQGGYFTPTECGTAMCFAGWACHLRGLEQTRPGSSDYWVETPEGSEHAYGVARSLLGLTNRQAEILFDGGNTRSMLELMVKDLCNDGDLHGDYPWDYRSG